MKFRSALATKLSGSLGGIVASHNRGGQYFRMKGVPTDPNSCRQQTSRVALGGAVNKWNNELTDEQRQGWEDYANAVLVAGWCGEGRSLTGQQQFIKANTPRLQAKQVLTGEFDCSLEQVMDAPTTYDSGNPPMPPKEFELNPDSLFLTGDIVGFATADGCTLVYAGRPQKHTRNYYRGPYQLATSIPIQEGDETYSKVVDLNEWHSDYTLPNPDDEDDLRQTPLRLRIAYVDGRLSQETECLVTPGELVPS